MLREPKVDFLIHCSDEQSDNMDAKSSSNAIHLTTNMHNLELGSLSYDFLSGNNEVLQCFVNSNHPNRFCLFLFLDVSPAFLSFHQTDSLPPTYPCRIGDFEGDRSVERRRRD